jgi:hypothetical protein
LTDLEKREGVVELLRTATRAPRKEMVEERWLPYLPGVAQFFVLRKELNLPRGFRTVWKTTSATSGKAR